MVEDELMLKFREAAAFAAITVVAVIAVAAAGMFQAAVAHESSQAIEVNKPVIKNLARHTLEGAEGLEVIVSHVTIPPNVTLPTHFHPGEEIAYVLHGSVTLLLEGEEERTLSEGAVGVVPLKKVHTARSGEEGVTVIVFRVHEQGRPDRLIVQ